MKKLRKPGVRSVDAEKMLRGKRVCLVDDDPGQPKLINHCLKGLDVRLDVFDHADAALDFLESERVDYILSDIMMPDTDGWELHSRLRRSEANATTPVIFTTCLISEMQERGMSDPANRCVTLAKPISRANLLRAVAELASAQ